MSTFCNCWRMDIKRAIFSKRFVLCVCLTVGIFMCASQYHAQLMPEVDVLWLCHAGVQQSGSVIFVMSLLPGLVYSGSYAEELQSGAVKHFVIRSGGNVYLISKYVIGILGGMLAFGMGLLMFAGIMSLRYPMLLYASDGGPLGILQQENRPILYLLLYSLSYMLSVALFCATGFALSVFVPNTLIVYAAPSVIYLILQRWSSMVLPIPYRIGTLVQSTVGETIAEAIGRKAIITGIYCLILGGVVLKKGKSNLRR